MKKFLIILLVLVILIVGAGVYGCIQVSKLETNFPGVTIDGVDVSGLTEEQTVRLLNDNGWKEKISTPLTVTTIGGHTFQLDPLKAGTGVPAEELAEQAYDCGRMGNIVTNFISYIKGWLGIGDMAVVSTGRTADRNYVGSCVDEAIAAVNEIVNVDEYTIDEEAEQIKLKKGAGQINLDRNAFVEAVAAALENGETILTYDTLAKDLKCPDFQKIYDGLTHETKDAYFTDDGKFDVIEEVVDYDFSVSEAERIWNNAKPAEDIVIPLKITRPEITGDSLRAKLYCDLLGTCTTYYPLSNENRRSNLRLATSKIDGMIMYPGDEFSYNTVVGARTEEAGFLPAAAYVNGEEKEEIGGGACQVSSTLYAATLFAFLETVERENHYFAVTYTQLGTDATVTIPTDGGRAIDFRFVNSRNYPIKLVGYCNNDESSITFEIWGTLEEDDYMPIEFDNSNSGRFNSDIKIEKADPDREGYILRLDHDTYGFSDEVGSGYRTLTWRRVLDASGAVVFEEMTNLINEKTGQHTMDTYYHHP